MESKHVVDPLEVLVRVGSISLAGLVVRYPETLRSLAGRLAGLLENGEVEVSGERGELQGFAERVRALGAEDPAEYRERLYKLLNEAPRAAEARLTLTHAGYNKARVLFGA